MDAITICAANYLPFAEVLGNTFLEHNPSSTFSILVIDSNKVNFTKKTRFKYLSPDDLNISSEQFKNMTFYYNVTELATALKPSAMKTMFSLGSEKVVYLDPDIQVFSGFFELEEQLNLHSIVLTPHTLSPIPRDGLRPSEADIMASGTFNLGFIGLSKSKVSETFLEWWEERLEFDSISDPEEMLFTDQRWIDLLPSYFPFQILRNKGYNVAYWNIHERFLNKKNEKIFVDNDELIFFHFSGYRPEKPWILSKYVADKPRVVISQNKILEELCEQYGQLAMQSGWEKESSTEYGYQNFESGKFIPSSLRRLYREDCISARKQGDLLKPPENWQEWATSRSIESGNLSRILFSIWKTRPDLKRRYPDATGTEAGDLLVWASTHGVEEKVIDSDLLLIGDLNSDSYPSIKSRENGINIAGYLRGELGLGQSARIIFQAAIATGLPITALNSNRSESRQGEVIPATNSKTIYPMTISIVNADHFKFWINDIGNDRIEGSTIVGVWAWEIEDFPKHMHSAFEYVDEIWAVSNFVKQAIQPHTNKKVLVFPTPITAPEIKEKLDRSTIGLPLNSKYNLFIFDYMSVFNRKNPIAVVEAHKKAFPNSDGPLLVIKSTNGDKDAENREKLRYSISSRTDVLLIENYLSRNQLHALIAECESYVSLHRSEGYGLTMAEAMALGKPVIATGYSGNLDFMSSENSLLVPYSMVKVGPGSFPYEPESFWAEPDLESAAGYMKNLFMDSDFKVNLGRLAKLSVTKQYPLENATNFIINRSNVHFSKIYRLKKSLKKKLQKLIKAAIILTKLIKNPKKALNLFK